MSDRSSKEEQEDERGKKTTITLPTEISPNRKLLRPKVESFDNDGGSGSSNGGFMSCQTYECGTDLSDAKEYCRRHKVCKRHAEAAFVLVNNIRQRLCQQCSKFHEITEFDDAKGSCRDRLAGHNKHRRKGTAR